MQQRDGEVTCSASGSPLSQHAREAIEAIVDRTAPATERRREQSFRWGVRWFCPADAEPLVESDGHLECGSCHRVVPGFLISELVELNPH